MKKKEYEKLGELLTKLGLLKTQAPTEISPLHRLSLRESQILVAIAMGTSPADAAVALGIAVKTFSTYRARLLEKLGLHSNAQLAILTFELGLVPGVLQTMRKQETEDEHIARDGRGTGPAAGQ